MAVLQPTLIEWDASFPETTLSFEDMVYPPNNNTLNIDLRSEVRVYRILKTNDYPSK